MTRSPRRFPDVEFDCIDLSEEVVSGEVPIGQILMEIRWTQPNRMFDSCVCAVDSLKKTGCVCFHGSERATEFSFVKDEL
jgi:hypothetical protein